jgi:hypothetical protein
MKKPATLRTTESGTALPPTNTAATVDGLKLSRTSRKADLRPTTMRMTFIEPEVEPAQPPTNIRATSSIRDSGGQVSKSAVAKPVVVRIEATWKSASRSTRPAERVGAVRQQVDDDHRRRAARIAR